MKTPSRSCSKPVRFLGTALGLAMSLSGYGVLALPATSAAAATVQVAQQPLTVQPSMPPDIVLMLDDSGSMRADYMPDFGYLKNNSDNDALINASNNGVYYNPAVTYTPPPYANGAAYASQTDITNVPQNGITGANGSIDLTRYDGRYECNHSQSCGLNSDGSPRGHIYFSKSVQSTTASTYSADAASNTDCQRIYDNTPGAFGNILFNNGVPTSGNGNCKFQYYPVNFYFQYSTGPAAGPYTVYYVASAKQGCGSQANCVTADTVADGTNGAPAGVDSAGNPLTVGGNIANWFAYYHTRILMAKSGLMTAFSDLDPSFRVGFGSINGNNTTLIGTLPNSFSFSTSTKSNNLLAQVAPFGAAADTTGQRFNFWNWIAGEAASGSTPLRQALNAVGQYYSSNDSSTPASHAWDMMSSDPGYVAGGTNTTQIACRQAYTILTTDGFWNSRYSGVGNADGTTGTEVTGPNGQSYTYSPVEPYSDSWSDTLADVAMHYWQTDLQPGMDNEVSPNTADPAFWQHMVTFTMGLGFMPTGITGTAPNGDSPPTTQDIFNWANGGAAITGFGWPQPSSDSINNIADLEHAGVNGRGGFFSATSPQSFVNGLKTALKRATERVGTGASLASNSTQLTVGTVIYQSNYFTGKWKGDLKALSVNAANGAISATPTWVASSVLAASATQGTGGVLTYPGREIYTYNPATGTFPAFANSSGAPPDLSATQKAALGSDATAQEAMVNYLRGDTTLEQINNGAFRNRDTPLGDIVNSQPVYSGAPDPNEFTNQSFYGTTVSSATNTVPFYDWAAGKTDSSGTFVASAASQRTPLVFVAGNDGMLHAFDGTTGTEVYAYLPGAVITAGLANLANPDYGSAADPHQFYNDGQLTIADAYVQLSQTGDTSPQWHTILVGTTGRGTARAVYALDVTDPGKITPLWERSAGDGLSGSGYIGQMVGKPVIAQTNYVPASGGTSASSTWSVLIGNGYNSTVGVSALLQFNLATGALNVHTTGDATSGNGLAAPVAWMDNPVNGVSTVAYAGDLHGQVWQFPLNDSTGSNPTPTSTGSLLFTAKDAGGNLQPITAGMLAGKDPHTGNVWLFFGTGEYLSSADLARRNTQTWYGIIVQSSTTKLVSNLANGRSALVQRTITAQTSGSNGLPARSVSTQVTSTDGSTDMKDKSGWYLDLLAPVGTGGSAVQQGERMVDPNQFQGSLLIGVTRIPLVTDVCNPSGSGWIMALDPFSGAAPGDDFFDVNNDGYINAGDRVGGAPAAGVGFGSLPNAPIFVGGIMETSFDNGTTASLKTAGTVGTIKRVTWRELVSP
ncbi:MAG TPA: PilC/PilY family type IV pilus protein [Rhodanobacteraceae bacterium]|nr:PilC/PilY family type IV pilus protein [Rhodanobacteraceae bacterium]